MNLASIAHVLNAQRRGKRFIARCPAHDDATPSLSIHEENGKLLVHCHAGCSQAAVINALKARDLWPYCGTGPTSSPPSRHSMKTSLLRIWVVSGKCRTVSVIFSLSMSAHSLRLLFLGDPRVGLPGPPSAYILLNPPLIRLEVPNDAPAITPRCVSVGELEHQIARLHNELDAILVEARGKFSVYDKAQDERL